MSSQSVPHVLDPDAAALPGSPPQFKAPKVMAYYTANMTSLLSRNNQLSYSYSYDKFGPQQMPIFGFNYIEHKLVEVLHLDYLSKHFPKK
ncbi:hypothetical protein F5148DRAFT_1287640 [Russula earlei]|uniref:Uncharacterized protein n=1 Tax=Russula earlei TaxID=71964 RepID=A0ACC0U1T7_9AGAM|nr:hypothetical protein F5148DRAFT_1287640 [Russula earlei]